MQTFTRTTIVACALLVSVGRAARAQGATNADAKTCDKAARIVEKGHPAQKEADAFLTLSGCGTVGANAIAAGLLTYANETDPVVLDAFMSQADNWRDAAIFDAATTLATNGSATPAARVFAVRHLLKLTHPYFTYSYGGLTAGDSTTAAPDGTVLTTIGCSTALGSESPDRVGTPLPADYATRIQTTLSSLAASPATPTVVRNAVRCGG